MLKIHDPKSGDPFFEFLHRAARKNEFAADSTLEESGFEPLVPFATEMLIELARGITNPTRMLAVGEIGPVPRLC
jgi:hypothetical protein